MGRYARGARGGVAETQYLLASHGHQVNISSPGVVSVSESRWLVPVFVGVWLVAAIAVGAAGLLEGLRPPVPQGILLLLTLAVLHLLYRVEPVRSWGLGVDARVFVAFHLTRFVGFEFLRLYERGELPAEFALTAGWGDIVVAVAAIPLLVAGPPAGRLRPWYLVWNVVGLVDILLVVGLATRLALADATALAPLLRFPLSLLITFVVPIVIATHVWLFRRIRGGSEP